MDAECLVEGIHYPGNLVEFLRWFPDDRSCANYLARIRWPEGFVCPLCGHQKGWTTKDGRFICGHCRKRTSATAGTALAWPRQPLRTWFLAAWTITNDKQGVSAIALQRLLGFKSDQTAWDWLHKLRRAMIRPRRDLLKGVIEVDETMVGGVEEGAVGRQTKTKSIVVIAAEVRPNRKSGRIRMGRVPDMSEPTLTAFVKSVAEPGSIIRTDGFEGYSGLEDAGFGHESINIKRSGRKAHEVLPRVHIIASLLKRWWLGTHQGSIRPEYIDYYLEEFLFRFNRRTSKYRGLLFYRLLEQAMMVEHTQNKDLIGKNLVDARSTS